MTVPLVILAGLFGPGRLCRLAGLFRREGRTLRPLPRGRLAVRRPITWPSRPRSVLVLAATAAALLGIGLAFFSIGGTGIPPAGWPSVSPASTGSSSGSITSMRSMTPLVVRPLVRGSEKVYRRFDLGVIDGALNGSAAAAGSAGRGLNVLQTRPRPGLRPGLPPRGRRLPGVPADMNACPIVVLIVTFLPLAGAVLLCLLPRRIGKAVRRSALAVSLLTFLAVPRAPFRLRRGLGLARIRRAGLLARTRPRLSRRRRRHQPVPRPPGGVPDALGPPLFLARDRRPGQGILRSSCSCSRPA